jgi:aminopeptidase N
MKMVNICYNVALVKSSQFADFLSSSCSGGVDMSVFARPNFLSVVQDALEKASLMLEFIQNYLSVPFPLPKLDLVALPQYSDPEPADHWGLIFLK